MRRVGIKAKGPAWADDPDRRLLVDHRPDLDRRGVGTQDLADTLGVVRQIESVMLLPRRMIGRDVQRREIMKIILNMRTFGDTETQCPENRDDLVDGLADRVNPPRRGPRDRQRHVNPFLRQATVEFSIAQMLRSRFKRGLNLVPNGIDRRPGGPPCIGVKLAQGLQPFGDVALAAKRGNPDLIQDGEGLGRSDARKHA